MSSEQIAIDEITTALRCIRKYEFEYEHEITGSSQQEIERSREELLRETLTQAFRQMDEESVAELRDNARSIFDELWAEHTESQYYQSNAQRIYDRQAVWGAVETYIDEHGVDHVSRHIAAGITGTFSRDIVPFEITADIDLLLEGEDAAIEIIRFLPTLSGVIWPFDGDQTHPIDDFLGGDEKYLRQKASVLQAIAGRLTTVQSFVDDPFADVAYQYIAVLGDTYPTGPITEDGAAAGSEINSRDMTGYINPNNLGSRVHDPSGAQLSNGQFALFKIAETILQGEYGLAQQNFEQIYEYTCQYCKYKQMCPDFINEEVSF